MDEKHVILIVDDTPENLLVLGNMLELEGYEVLVATSGPDALKNARETPTPDLILLDIMMPVMDGYEVCRHLKADADLKNIPVIFISALGMTGEKIHAFREGAVDYVTKPFQAEEVVARVHTHIQLARTEELKREIVRRKLAEEELHNLNTKLDELVFDRTAQLKEANECLESFCSSISHDLRTPLADISSLCQILADKYADKFGSEGAELIEYILTGTQNMLDRIQALLKFSRLSHGEIVRSSIDLSSLARKIMKSLCETEPERKITLALQEGISAEVAPTLIYDVMENLLGNAWKYTGKTPNPQIEFGAEDCDGTRIFYVRDNGAGFNMAKADKLFGMFQRLHGESDFAGDGIGLATVKRIITRHGGRIWAEAEPGKGATFWFTLS